MAKPPIIADNTPEEEATIRAAIAGDPDTWVAAPDATPRRRGRPSGTTKTQVTLKLDNDMLEVLRAGGKGWQTRANAAMRAGLGL
ncbi:MAG: BrnA antitoxin family protein [Planktomarina sp.]